MEFAAWRDEFRELAMAHPRGFEPTNPRFEDLYSIVTTGAEDALGRAQRSRSSVPARRASSLRSGTPRRSSQAPCFLRSLARARDKAEHRARRPRRDIRTRSAPSEPAPLPQPKGPRGPIDPATVGRSTRSPFRGDPPERAALDRRHRRMSGAMRPSDKRRRHRRRRKTRDFSSYVQDGLSGWDVPREGRRIRSRTEGFASNAALSWVWRVGQSSLVATTIRRRTTYTSVRAATRS